jgi:hypothetical protein
VRKVEWIMKIEIAIIYHDAQINDVEESDINYEQNEKTNEEAKGNDEANESIEIAESINIITGKEITSTQIEDTTLKINPPIEDESTKESKDSFLWRPKHRKKKKKQNPWKKI